MKVCYTCTCISALCIGQKKKKLCCPCKMRQKRVGFFVCFFVFLLKCQIWAAKICIQWLKKALLMYRCVLICIPPEFSPFRKFYWKTTVSRYVKKKKIHIPIDRPNSHILVGVRATLQFKFVGLRKSTLLMLNVGVNYDMSPNLSISCKTTVWEQRVIRPLT